MQTTTMQTETQPTDPRPADLPPRLGAPDPVVDFWNDVLTPKWIRFRPLLSGSGAIHTELALPDVRLRPGARVLDAACGFGESTLELARRVGPDGHVLGVDCTRAFLAIAERERAAAGAENVRYQEGDIGSCVLPAGSFDVAFSRFGMTFSASPVGALRNVRAALAPGGMLHLINWRACRDNPCWAEAEAVALAHVPPPPAEAVSCGPGPFSMSDPETVRRMLDAAGFTDVRMQRMDADICVGRSLDEAVEYAVSVGPAGFVIRTAGEHGRAALPTILSALRDHFRAYERPDGSVWMPSSTWHVSARRAG